MNLDAVVRKYESLEKHIPLNDVLLHHLLDFAAFDERAQFVDLSVRDDGGVDDALLQLVISHEFICVNLDELEHSHKLTAITAQVLRHFQNICLTLILLYA